MKTVARGKSLPLGADGDTPVIKKFDQRHHLIT